MLKRFFLVVFVLFFAVANAFAAENPRWVGQPIYVYVPSQYGQYSKLMRQGFLAWQEKSDGLVRFKFVSSPNDANIQVKFMKHVENCNSEHAVGCSRMMLRGGNYYKNTLEIAMRRRGQDNVSRPIKNIYGCMLHEIGHAIGLDHSNDPYSIMYPIDLPTLQYLTKSDIQLLYKKYH